MDVQLTPKANRVPSRNQLNQSRLFNLIKGRKKKNDKCEVKVAPPWTLGPEGRAIPPKTDPARDGSVSEPTDDSVPLAS